MRERDAATAAEIAILGLRSLLVVTVSGFAGSENLGMYFSLMTKKVLLLFKPGVCSVNRWSAKPQFLVF